MKNLLFCFLILVFTLNCHTPQPMEKSVSPNFKKGCSEYRGAARTKCIQGLLSELEQLRDPTRAIQKTIVENRHDSNWILVQTEFCPAQNLCWTDYRYEYKPTFWGRVRDYATVGGVGYILGLVSIFSI